MPLTRTKGWLKENQSRIKEGLKKIIEEINENQQITKWAPELAEGNGPSSPYDLVLKKCVN